MTEKQIRDNFDTIFTALSHLLKAEKGHAQAIDSIVGALKAQRTINLIVFDKLDALEGLCKDKLAARKGKDDGR